MEAREGWSVAAAMPTAGEGCRYAVAGGGSRARAISFSPRRTSNKGGECAASAGECLPDGGLPLCCAPLPAHQIAMLLLRLLAPDEPSLCLPTRRSLKAKNARSHGFRSALGSAAGRRVPGRLKHGRAKVVPAAFRSTGSGGVNSSDVWVGWPRSCWCGESVAFHSRGASHRSVRSAPNKDGLRAGCVSAWYKEHFSVVEEWIDRFQARRRLPATQLAAKDGRGDGVARAVGGWPTSLVWRTVAIARREEMQSI